MVICCAWPGGVKFHVTYYNLVVKSFVVPQGGYFWRRLFVGCETYGWECWVVFIRVSMLVIFSVRESMSLFLCFLIPEGWTYCTCGWPYCFLGMWDVIWSHFSEVSWSCRGFCTWRETCSLLFWSRPTYSHYSMTLDHGLMSGMERWREVHKLSMCMICRCHPNSVGWSRWYPYVFRSRQCCCCNFPK